MARLDRTIGNQTFIFLVTSNDIYGEDSSYICSDVCFEVFEEFQKVHPELKITHLDFRGTLWSRKYRECLWVILINHKQKVKKISRNRV